MRTTISNVVVGIAVVALGACLARLTEDSGQEIGATYQVGPTRIYKSLTDVAPLLKPGDVVNVDGNATYGAVTFTKPATASASITIRGMNVNGKRPVISGGTNTVHFAGAHYYQFENFEVTGGSFRCVFHEADHVTLRFLLVHDCPAHGLLGADNGSGSLTLEYSEFHHTGAGDRKHQIYMTTDQEAYPGSVFRMQYNYVHDGNGGNNVKSRAERNEIYYNWVETAYYHELELIGPDPGSGVNDDLKREDSDVVGNVLRKTAERNFIVTRFGGDGTGETNGRYRFVNNTVIVSDATPVVFRLYDGLQSVEMHNNVFYNSSGGGVAMVRDADASWTNGRAITGSHNWVSQGSTTVPPEWQDTITGTNPGFTNLSAYDLTPTSTSPLVDHGVANPPSSASYPFPSPLAVPASLPPSHVAQATATTRPVQGAIDIGAFELSTSGGNTHPPPATSGWKNQPISAQTAVFIATFDVTPSAANMDGVVGLSNGWASAYTDLGPIVQFNVNGMMFARNGGSYQSTTAIAYTAGKTYRVRLRIDLAAHRYSAYVTPPGSGELTIGRDFAFRTEQANVARLDNLAGYALIGSQQIQVVSVVPEAGPGSLIANSGFETGLAGWDTWDAVLAQVSAPHTGSYAARICGTTSAYTIDDNPASVTAPAAGSTYTGSVWVRASTGTPAVQLVLRERSATGTVSTRSTSITVDGTWRQLTATRTLTSATPSSLEIIVEGAGSGTCFLADDFALAAQ